MRLLTYRVQYETLQTQPGKDHGILTIGTFQAYSEADLQQVMRTQLGYAPPIYYIIEPVEDQPKEQWQGIIIEHRPAPETFGGVAVHTFLGNYAVVKEDQKKASENIGAPVIVTPVEQWYKTVRILDYKKDVLERSTLVR